MTSHQPSLPGASSASAESARKIDLNLTQVAAAALAAITAAVLGSTIGVAGTILGAALASIVTTVSSTMYRYSLERSRERVAQRLLTARTSPLPIRSEPIQSDPTQSGTGDPEVTRTTATPVPARPHWMLRWTAMAVGSVAAFVLAMMVITGFESATGQALSGGGSPTVPSVFGGEPSQPEPEAPPPATTEPAEDGATTSAPAATTSVPDETARTTAERTTAPAEPSAGEDEPVLPVPTGRQRPQ